MTRAIVTLSDLATSGSVVGAAPTAFKRLAQYLSVEASNPWPKNANASAVLPLARASPARCVDPVLVRVPVVARASGHARTGDRGADHAGGGH